MTVPWADAIARCETSPASLQEAIEQELVSLWSDLDTARSFAMNGSWSMACDWLTERIVTLSRLVGATPWGSIPIPRLLDGTYQGILDLAGIGYDPPDMDEVRALDDKRRADKMVAYQKPGMILNNPDGWRGTPTV